MTFEFLIICRVYHKSVYPSTHINFKIVVQSGVYIVGFFKEWDILRNKKKILKFTPIGDAIKIHINKDIRII